MKRSSKRGGKTTKLGHLEKKVRAERNRRRGRTQEVIAEKQSPEHKRKRFSLPGIVEREQDERRKKARAKLGLDKFDEDGKPIPETEDR